MQSISYYLQIQILSRYYLVQAKVQIVPSRFFVVCLYSTDAQVESGFQEAPESVRVGIRDVREYLNATQAHARWLLVTNYKELEERLKLVLTSTYTPYQGPYSAKP